MNKEQLYEAIGFADDALLARSELTPARRSRKGLVTAACAACAALAVCAGIWYTRPAPPAQLPASSGPQQPTLPQLPTLTVSDGSSGAGMGFEGYLANDISELARANPWNETMRLETLPVFRNGRPARPDGVCTEPAQWPLNGFYADDTMPAATGPEAYAALLREVAARLGLDADSLEIRDNAPSPEDQSAQRKRLEEKGGEPLPDDYFAPSYYFIETDALRIEVDTKLTVSIWFEPTLPLPEGYSFDEGSSYADVLAAGECLLQTYGNILGMNDPQLDIGGGDRDIYGKRHYTVSAYENAETDAGRIVNYAFRRAQFFARDNSLWILRLYHPDCSDKVADYPIISADEAKRLLLAGSYATSVPYPVPGEEYVAKTELVYRISAYDEYFIPYYRFYVRLPDAPHEGADKMFGAYYVPAVHPQYIANMPTYNGRFN